MNKKVGFIGCGNMGKAILNGLISGKIISPDTVFVHNHSPASTDRVAQEFGVHGETQALEAALPSSAKVVRLMPNTPALVNAGMTSVTVNAYLTDEETELVMSLCRSFGRAELVPESLIDAVIGVSGSAPAYVFMFIEAMADAAVAGGMPRKQAYEFAAQTVMGAAKMVLETGKHPGELKDMVCSPGGTTIEAVIKLEEMGLRQAVIAGVRSATEKSQEMSRK